MKRRSGIDRGLVDWRRDSAQSVADASGGVPTGGTNAIWFTAGINGEQDGLLGVLRK